MEAVKNNNDKTVCYADANQKKVEIVQRGYKTTVIFKESNKMEIINSKIK